MRRKSTAKKDKSSRTSTNPSSPASIKGSKRKSKKAKGESSKAFTMSELHTDPLPSSGAATPVANPTVKNVDTSGKTSVNLGLNIPKSDKTQGVETPAISGNLGKSVPNSPIAVDTNIGATTETNADVPDESPTKLENLVDYSESDESPQPKGDDKETVPDKVVNENPEVIIVNETTVSEKAGKVTGKKPLYGPPKPVSKVIPRTEAKKRKAPPTSDSEFEPETDIAASCSTSRKSIGRKKVPQSVPYAPLDNVSFHLENGSARWKFVYHMRLALERNLKDDILECPSVVEALEYTASPEYRQVFVRGKCVKFSPTVINQYLQRNSDEVAALKVTDSEVCKVLTGGRIKVMWPEDWESSFMMWVPRQNLIMGPISFKKL
ncbi:uncharacterized protein LOC123886094 [Trifolium pratense]|uniref:uncharacterized protein LOC123886094 n=1 Tax=Trifolium pratense TaxID=57577 RepID=UPI001E695392|nr:uncharacterized protein LOC123886094 [Trifolium pratense]